MKEATGKTGTHMGTQVQRGTKHPDSHTAPCPCLYFLPKRSQVPGRELSVGKGDVGPVEQMSVSHGDSYPSVVQVTAMSAGK